MPGVAPAILEEGGVRPGGAKGNALFFTDTNRGFLGKDVGYYERTQPFSFDLWIYAASEYENSQVLNHRDDDNSGGAGYKLNLEKNHLSFYMMHSWPYNMLHVISKAQVPVKRVDPRFHHLRWLQLRLRDQCLYQRQGRRSRCRSR